jgi:Zn-dependent M16 (insulinase) family peptidase
MPAPHVTSPDYPLLRVASELIESEYLRPEIRFKGNAYGTHCTYQSLTRQLMLTSYRDPHITRTMEIFQGTRDYVAGAPWVQADVDRAVIATAKSEFTPIRPGDATGRALSRHLSGYSDDMQQAHYDLLRGARVEPVREAALRALDSGMPLSSLCVAANRSAIESSKASWQGRPIAILDIRR